MDSLGNQHIQQRANSLVLQVLQLFTHVKITLHIEAQPLRSTAIVAAVVQCCQRLLLLLAAEEKGRRLATASLPSHGPQLSHMQANGGTEPTDKGQRSRKL